MVEYEAPRPSGYTIIQIALHWLIAALVAFQLIFGEVMVEAMEAVEEGEPLPAGGGVGIDLHIWVGVSILVLAVARLIVRLGHGSPPPPAGSPPIQVLAANVVHWAFYALLIGVPITGLAAWYVTPAAGDIHTLAKPAFIILILLHLAGVAWHQFVGKDTVMQRMVLPAK